jgi:putative pyruvate formate lyase activating enzyme
LQIAHREGLKIPVLWNSSAYEKVETLRALEDYVDIYLPDWKYYHSLYARRYSRAEDYPAVAFAAIQEMVRQKGYLSCDEQGIAQKGVLLRLLVLPRGISGTEDILRKLADEIGTDMPLSLMAQYYPAGEAFRFPELSRGITEAEYQKVLDTAMQLGFTRVYQQELSCSDEWTPEFIQEFPASEGLL